MCAIAGIINFDGAPVDSGLIGKMCDFMRHRGPDDRGTQVLDHVALGHQRLSIIDLSANGRNPVANEDGTVWLVCNGEIYNYQPLRSDLIARGHVFKSQTDTEVILHLYEEKGAGCVEDLNGMFAFAIWDAGAGRLLLARDRFGINPLYHTRVGRSLFFASEIKAFIAVPGFRAAADPLAMAEHFTFQNTFGDRTLFKGVGLLEAGTVLLAEAGEVRTRRYWDLRFDNDFGPTADQWAHGLRERFEAAVSRQLMSDVPLGTYLSGGMDTGAISAVSAASIPGLHTFTCGFDLPEGASGLERYFDERREARHLSEIIGTAHHELEIGPDAMRAIFPKVVWHLDEPRVGISYQVYAMAELIGKYVTVVLSGVGGDELFAGYPWRYGPVAAWDTDDFNDRYYRMWIRFLDDAEKKTLFSDAVNRQLTGFSTADAFDGVMRGFTGEKDPLNMALYFDFKTFLNGLLIVDDKLSMAHSLEARVPFLDNELVAYVSRIPPKFKFSGGSGKIVLKAAMKGLLPEETLNRRKQGFTPPDQTWYKGGTLDYIRELIQGPRALERDYFRPAAIEAIIDDHLAGRRNHRFLIWSLMAFEWWNRLFVDGEHAGMMG